MPIQIALKRPYVECRGRVQHLQLKEKKKGSFSSEEDNIVRAHDPITGKWTDLGDKINRTARSVKIRYFNLKKSDEADTSSTFSTSSESDESFMSGSRGEGYCKGDAFTAAKLLIGIRFYQDASETDRK
jgi:hypothetical protein